MRHSILILSFLLVGCGPGNIPTLNPQTCAVYNEAAEALAKLIRSPAPPLHLHCERLKQ